MVAWTTFLKAASYIVQNIGIKTFPEHLPNSKNVHYENQKDSNNLHKTSRYINHQQMISHDRHVYVLTEIQ